MSWTKNCVSCEHNNICNHIPRTNKGWGSSGNLICGDWDGWIPVDEEMPLIYTMTTEEELSTPDSELEFDYLIVDDRGNYYVGFPRNDIKDIHHCWDNANMGWVRNSLNGTIDETQANIVAWKVFHKYKGE